MFLGGDPPEMVQVAQVLSGFSVRAGRLATQVQDAEVLAELSTHSVGAVEDLATTMRATSLLVERSAMELAIFRLPAIGRASELTEPTWVRGRGGDPTSTSAGRAGSAGNTSGTSNVVVDELGVVGAAIAARMTPAEAGMDRDMFPPGYLEWLSLDRLVTAAQQRVVSTHLKHADQRVAAAHERQQLEDERAALPIHQLMFDAGQKRDIEPSISQVAALVAAAQGLGATGQELGAALARGNSDVDVDLGSFAKLLASDPEIAKGWVRELGEQDLVEKLRSWARKSMDELRAALADLSLALGAVSKSPDVSFSGERFVQADYPTDRIDIVQIAGVPGDSFHVELLLLGGNFDDRFVLDAVEASLARIEEQREQGTFPPWEMDRRLTALAALLDHGLVIELLAERDITELAALAHGARLGSSVGGDGAFGYGSEHTWLAADLDVLTLVFAATASDSEQAQRLANALAAFPANGSGIDPRAADGIDVALASILAHQSGRLRDSSFPAAYAEVLRAGSGLATHLSSMGSAIVTVTEEGLGNGGDLSRVEAKLERFGELFARVRTMRHEMLRDDAEQTRRSQEQFDKLVKLASLGVGVGGVAALGATGALAGLLGPAIAIAGLVLAMAGMLGGANGKALVFVQRLLIETTNAFQAISDAIKLGAVRAGSVRGPQGQVNLEEGDLTGAKIEVEGLEIQGQRLEDWLAGRTRDLEKSFEREALRLACSVGSQTKTPTAPDVYTGGPATDGQTGVQQDCQQLGEGEHSDYSVPGPSGPLSGTEHPTQARRLFAHSRP